jgi:two-component sensor histidine kinase
MVSVKTGLGYILGEFFTNASGHPGGSKKGGKQSIHLLITFSGNR